jgi:hypothetical protein
LFRRGLVWPERRGFGLTRKEVPKVVLKEALTEALMGAVGGLSITELEDDLTGHRKVGLEGSLIVDLSVSLKVGLKVSLTLALKVSLSVDLSMDLT